MKDKKRYDKKYITRAFLKEKKRREKRERKDTRGSRLQFAAVPTCGRKKKRVSQKEKKKHIPAIVLSVISEVLSLIDEGVCVRER